MYETNLPDHSPLTAYKYRNKHTDVANLMNSSGKVIKAVSPDFGPLHTIYHELLAFVTFTQ